MGKGKKIAIGVGIAIALIFVALIAIGSSIMAKAKALDFTVGKTDSEAGFGNTTTYYYEIDFVNTDSGKYHLSPLNFKLISNTNSVYTNFFLFSAFNEKPALAGVELGQNQHSRGYIAFIVPNSEIPKELQYSDGSAITITKTLD